LKREKPLVSGLDGLKALQVAEAALHSSKLGRAVDLKEG
jgi:predicted dehydrogenase